MSTQPMDALQDRLGYRFTNDSLLEEALSHSSFVNEHPGQISSNERLEFLGDAVLNLIVGQLLMNAFPLEPEGILSRMRAELVNEQQLARLAESLTLGHHLMLGKGEAQTGGDRKPSILADAMEAVIAAIYMDGGFDAAFQMVRRLVAPMIDNELKPGRVVDYKSRLQEHVQQRGMAPPAYTLAHVSGPDHDRRFTVTAAAGDHLAEGQGKSKKAAEQDAARNVLLRMSLLTDP
jgi:ribonuclease III